MDAMARGTIVGHHGPPLRTLFLQVIRTGPRASRHCRREQFISKPLQVNGLRDLERKNLLRATSVRVEDVFGPD